MEWIQEWNREILFIAAIIVGFIVMAIIGRRHVVLPAAFRRRLRRAGGANRDVGGS